MELKPLNNSDKAWSWMAMDYADGAASPEMFAVRFKSPELAQQFKTAFDSFKEGAPRHPVVGASSDEPATNGTATTLPKPAEAKEEPKKEEPTASGFSFGVKTEPKSTGFSFGAIKTEPVKPVQSTGFGQVSTPPKNEGPAEMSARLEREKLAKELQAAASSNKFSFGTKSAAPATTSAAPAPAIFGGAAGTSAGGNKTFSFGASSGGASFSFGSKDTGKADYTHIGFGATAEESHDDEDDLFGYNSEASDSEEESSIQIESTEVADNSYAPQCELFKKLTGRPSEELVQKAISLGLAETFYNYLEAGTPSEPNTFPWENETDSSLPKPSFGRKSPPASGGFSFGKSSSGGFNFGGGSSGGGFGAVNSGATGFSFQADSPNNAFKNAGQSLFSSEDQKAENNTDECTATFKPVLEELPPEIQVKTGLEEETELFSHRAKLFRFASEVSPPEWKERGLGDVKITQNKTTKRYRVVMRREQVFKICANHYITAEMSLKANSNSDRAWMWTAMDYGDPNEPVGQVQNFCIRFKNGDIANDFKKVFEECQVGLLNIPMT